MQSIGEEFSREDAVKALNSSNEAALVTNLSYYGAAALELGYGDAVAKLLGHSSPEVAAAACEAIGNMGGVKYGDYLPLAHGSAKVRAAAVGAIGAFGEEGLKYGDKLAKLISETSSADEQVKVVAIQALGMIGAKDQLATVTSLMADKSPDVQGAACLALSSLGGGDSLASDIAAKLSSEGTRFSAITALAALGEEACKPVVGDIVAKCLSDGDSQTRAEAIGILAKLPEETLSSAGKIKELLKDKNPAVRAAAALSLGNCGGKASSHASDVAALLKDDDEDLAWLPLQIGGGSTREPMAMRKPKCAALVALGAMKAEAEMSQVGEFLSDGDWEVRFCAVEALGIMGPAAKDLADKVGALLDDDTYPVRAKACFAVGSIGAEDLVDRLSEMLQDATQSVRSEAAAALGMMGEAAVQYTHELAKMLSDPSSPVRGAAAGALGNLGDGGKPYASIVASLLYDTDHLVVASACSALGKMDAYGAAFAEDVAWFLEYPVPAVRAAAALALASMGSEGAVYSGQIRSLTGDADASVAKAASQASSMLMAIKN
mmetsp:Transcript_160491/g.389830  ORF Transcript_160491/g.389830 Transcript_160491/m.389830 type:complete len:548 (+) Transcript_160491:58-1701(+)